jgi:indolepyruvate ferredoxin oxidoreductase
VLAKLKFLRGTAFDLFGKTDERRTERALISEYTDLIDELLSGLTPENMSLALKLAALPEQIRGFGHVKEKNLETTRDAWQALLAQWRSPDGTRHQRIA